MKTLKARLNKELKNAYLLEGDDLYLFDKAFSMIKKACNLTMEEFNFAQFDDDNFVVDKFLDSTQVLPLIDSKRLILIKNVTKVTNSDLKKISNYLSSPVASTIIVIYDFYNKFNLLKNEMEFVDCKRFDSQTAQAVIVAELAKRGKQISQDALATFFDYSNGYLTKAMNEIDKIVFFDKENTLITKQIIEECVVKENEFIVYELTEALGKRDVDKAMVLAQRLVKEQGIITLVANHFRRMFFVSISDKSDEELAKDFAIKEYAIKKILQMCKNFSKMQLKKIFTLIDEIDYKIKSGQMLSENAFNYLILKILYI